jgi:hypothetical protein
MTRAGRLLACVRSIPLQASSTPPASANLFREDSLALAVSSFSLVIFA